MDQLKFDAAAVQTLRLAARMAGAGPVSVEHLRGALLGAGEAALPPANATFDTALTRVFEHAATLAGMRSVTEISRTDLFEALVSVVDHLDVKRLRYVRHRLQRSYGTDARSRRYAAEAQTAVQE